MNKKTCMCVYRVSTTSDSNQFENQRQTIKDFVDDQGWECIKEYPIHGTSRWKMEKKGRADLLAETSRLKPDYLVFRDHSRIGFNGYKEMFKFLENLEKLNVTVATSDNGLIYDTNNPKTYRRIMSKHTISREEIKTLSYKSQIGRKKTFRRNSFAGGIPPYGYDVLVLDPYGIEKYRVRYEGFVECAGEKKTRKKTKKNQAWQRVIIYPDGSTERADDYFEPHEFLGHAIVRCAPQQPKKCRRLLIANPDRTPVVQDIFSLTLAGFIPEQIVKHLMDKSIPFYNSPVWLKGTVQKILSRSVYRGSYVDGVGAKVKTQAKAQATPIQLTDQERDNLTIVTEDTWQRVQEVVKSRKSIYKKRTWWRHSDFWLNDIVKCARTTSP